MRAGVVPSLWARSMAGLPRWIRRWSQWARVLVEEEDGFSSGADAGPGAGGLDLHEGYETVDLWFAGGEFGEDAAEAESVFAEGGADEVFAGGGGVALVEDEVDDLEDGGEAGGEIGAAGDFEGDVFFAKGAFGTDDGSGVRKARAISGVVRPPRRRRVRAVRASVERTGWQEMKMSRRTVDLSPMGYPELVVRSGTVCSTSRVMRVNRDDAGLEDGFDGVGAAD